MRNSRLCSSPGFVQYVNDTLGHSVGDLLLKSVAERLTHNLRDVDTIAEWVEMSSP